MKRLLFILAASGALLLQAQKVPVRRSQQFTVVDARPVNVRSPGRLKTTSGEDLIKLDPDVLLLSAERIREALLRELALPPTSGGAIRLMLYPAQRADDLIGLVSAISPKGWEYELDVPDQVEPQKLIRGVIGVVLLEIANRGQSVKSAEIPLWMLEGLTIQVSEVAGPDLVIGAVPLGSMWQIVRVREGLDYLKTARTVLRSYRPISFAELAHPDPAALTGGQLKVYQYSAQLFVYNLLHVDQGPAKLTALLRSLPKCWNWDTALLQAYTTEFHNVLEVEKRWSVDVLAFTATDPSQVRSRIAGLKRLDDVLTVVARVHRAPQALPERAILTLQQVLTEWEYAAQIPVLQQKIALLSSLRLITATELIQLIDDYQRTLASYLQKRYQAGRTPETRMQVTYNAVLVAEDAVRELDRLDQRRKALQPEQSLSVHSTITPSR